MWRRPVGAAGAAGDEGCDGGLAPDLDRGGGRGKGIGAGGASEVGRLGFGRGGVKWGRRLGRPRGGSWARPGARWGGAPGGLAGPGEGLAQMGQGRFPPLFFFLSFLLLFFFFCFLF